MKLGGKKKAVTGRQRRQSDWQRPASFSYSSQRVERPDVPGRRPQPSLAAKRSRLLSVRFWARRSGLLIAVIVGFICLISILSLSNEPRVILLDSNGSSYTFHDAEQYQQAAAKHLGSSVWNKNKITVNTGKASADLQKQFPELADVAITLPLIGHRPIYHLRANPPAFILQAINGSYVLDSGGKALIAKDAASESTIKDLTTITDQTGLRAQIGKQVLSSSEADFMRTVVDTFAAKNITVTALVLPADGAHELHVRLAGKAYLVKFNMLDNKTARQQAGTYLATINSLSAQNIVPAQYVDVRVLGRAYYQ